jgi:hypothetical protein
LPFERRLEEAAEKLWYHIGMDYPALHRPQHQNPEVAVLVASQNKPNGMK